MSSRLIEEFKLSKNNKHNDSNNVNLKVPKNPPKSLLINPKKIILRSLVNPFPMIEISTMINKKVKTKEAILI